MTRHPPDSGSERAALLAIVALCVLALVLYSLIPPDSLDPGLLYEGF